MKLFIYFLLTSLLTWSSVASTCLGSDETAYMAFNLGKGDVVFFDGLIPFNCNECSVDLMYVAQAADGLVSAHMIPDLLEDLANRCQAECCQGFYPEKHLEEEKASEPFAGETTEASLLSDEFCQGDFVAMITRPIADVQDSITYPLSYPLMSFEEIVECSNSSFDGITELLVNETTTTLDEDVEIFAADETKTEVFLRRLQALFSAVIVGVLGLLCVFYLFIISLVVYVWGYGYFQDEIDASGNNRFEELMRHLLAEKELNEAIKNRSGQKKTKEIASQTTNDDFAAPPAPLEVCSSETDVTFEDISQSHA